MPPAEKAKKESKAQKDAAAKLAARQEAAENAFAQADADGSGQVDATELQGLLMNLLTKEGIEEKVRDIQIELYSLAAITRPRNRLCVHALKLWKMLQKDSVGSARAFRN